VQHLLGVVPRAEVGASTRPYVSQQRRCEELIREKRRGCDVAKSVEEKRCSRLFAKEQHEMRVRGIRNCSSYGLSVSRVSVYRREDSARCMPRHAPCRVLHEARRANKDSKNTCAVQKAVQVCPALAGVKFLCHHCVCHLLLLSSVVCDTSKDARQQRRARSTS